MYQSKLFYKTLKNAPKDAEAISQILLTRAGFIDQTGAGSYAFLPLGFKVLSKIENIIREEMIKIDGQEILMPALTPKENWQKTGRWKNFDVLFKLKGSNKKEYALAPTHEEIVAPLAKKIVFSYKDLPFYLFQIQTKFRDELRVKSGLIRTREFLMKDLYSFHSDEKDLENYYDKVSRTYETIFKRCGVSAYKTWASGGTFSEFSHEYQSLTDSGEDLIYLCKKCRCAVNEDVKNKIKNCPNCKNSDLEKKKSVEIGNIFKLGNKYSLPFELKFRDKEGKEKNVIMGCYGIGLGRLMAVAVELNNDSKGIIWPKEIAPFDIHLIQIGAKKEADKIYNKLKNQGKEVLYDDRENVSIGEKFAEADLIGIPVRLVVSEKTLKNNCLEVKKRDEDKICLTEFSHISQII
ncbi:MAG: aminoacyl--tRNA ligase-related protein [bacterium]|nr:aminoacyl--tRNA ligase-related protein [bacterium]